MPRPSSGSRCVWVASMNRIGSASPQLVSQRRNQRFGCSRHEFRTGIESDGANGRFADRTIPGGTLEVDRLDQQDHQAYRGYAVVRCVDGRSLSPRLLTSIRSNKYRVTCCCRWHVELNRDRLEE